jgi:hypothetical protein
MANASVWRAEYIRRIHAFRHARIVDRTILSCSHFQQPVLTCEFYRTDIHLLRKTLAVNTYGRSMCPNLTDFNLPHHGRDMGSLCRRD